MKSIIFRWRPHGIVPSAASRANYSTRWRKRKVKFSKFYLQSPLGEAAHWDPHHHHRPPVRSLSEDLEDEERVESSHEPEARLEAASDHCRISSVDGRRWQWQWWWRSEWQLRSSRSSAAGMHQGVVLGLFLISCNYVWIVFSDMRFVKKNLHRQIFRPKILHL